MSDTHRSYTLATVVALALAASALAASPAATDTSGVAPEPPRAGFRADYLMELERLQARMLALAAEVPPAIYAESGGVESHSLAECFTGLAAASRRILLGMEREVHRQSPADSADEKSRIVDDLTATLEAVHAAVEQTPDEGLEAPIDFLGRRWTRRALFLLLLGQMHEGLGHAAAHAESAGIVPPWLREKRSSDANED